MGVVNQRYERYKGVNPFKGFVPFIGEYELESSMEFFYMPLNKILVSDDKIVWEEFEYKLNEIYKRNHTSIIRIYIDYPSLELGLPEYLKNKVELFKYEEFGGGIEPNYNNDLLINELIKFICLFGKKYDGDKRIAFIQCGLIGHWGEWHCYPKNELMPTEVQLERIIKSYIDNFKTTKILTRNPKYRFLKKYNIGFHDDSFCYSTLPTRDYHFVSQLKQNDLDSTYLMNPIGGEVRPEEQSNLISNIPTKEDFYECIKNTNCSWLIIQKAFDKNNDIEYINELSSWLGYDFYIDNVELNNNIISFNLINVGIAPIYYDFDCILNIINKSKTIKIKLDYDLKKLVPNSSYRFSFNISNMEYNEITFSLERDNQIINFSNTYKKDNSVILYMQ